MEFKDAMKPNLDRIEQKLSFQFVCVAQPLKLSSFFIIFIFVVNFVIEKH